MSEEKEEKTYSIPESLLLGVLNYLVTQPYQNVASLINSIQVAIQGQQEDKKE